MSFSWLMLFRNDIIALFFLLNICPLFGQEFFVANSESSGVQRFIQENNVKAIDFIYQNQFVTNNKFDKVKFVKSVNDLIPGKFEVRKIVLDWEGETFDDLLCDGKRGVNAREEFIKAIEFGRKLRPNIQWGYYGLPTRDFWKLDNDWKNKNIKISDFYSRFDFFAPSLYIFYSYDEVAKEKQFNYIDENIKLSKRIARRKNLGVYPVINHRYHPSNRTLADELVPPKMFEDYIHRIREHNIEGIIWWHSEEYNYRISNKNSVFRKDYIKKNKNKSHYDMFNTYKKSIK